MKKLQHSDDILPQSWEQTHEYLQISFFFRITVHLQSFYFHLFLGTGEAVTLSVSFANALKKKYHDKPAASDTDSPLFSLALVRNVIHEEDTSKKTFSPHNDPTGALQKGNYNAKCVTQ